MIKEYNYYKIVDNFIYLGVQPTKDGNEVDETKRWIQLANEAIFSVQSILKASCIYKKAKFRVYKTIIRTVLCYRSESWTLTQTNEYLQEECPKEIHRI